MKILHTADLHLGSAMNAKLSPERAKERKAELFSTFEKLAERASLAGAEVFIIAGDLFDTKSLLKRDIERTIATIERHPDIDFLYLFGNHEKNALLESGSALPSNLKLFGKDWTYFTYGDLTIAGRGELAEDMFRTLSVNPDGKTVVVLHGGIGDRCDGETVGLKDAKDIGIDYIALGHYHSYGVHKVDDRCVAVYAGTPEGRGFDECGTKGYVIIDTDGRRMTHDFYPIAGRTVHRIEVDITEATSMNDINDAVAAALDAVKSRDLVRVELIGTHRETLFPDKMNIERRYKDRYYYFEVEDNSRIEINPETYKGDKSLKGEFIRLCIDNTELSDEDREAIIRVGLSALLGEEIEI